MVGERIIHMKTFIFALIGLLGVTLGAPLAEARDKHRKHHHDRNYSREYRHHRQHNHYRHYRHYPRSSSYRYYSPRYYSYPRSYGYYDDYSYRRPGLTFYFGR